MNEQSPKKLERSSVYCGPRQLAILFLLVLTLFLAPSVFAEPVLEVEWKGSYLNVVAESVPLSQVLQEVARTTGLEIQGLEGLEEDVSVRFSGLSLREGLKNLLEQVNHVILEKASPRGGTQPFLVQIFGRGSLSSPRAIASKNREEGRKEADSTVDAAENDRPPTRFESLERLVNDGQASESTVVSSLGEAAADKDMGTKRYAIQELTQREGPEAIEHLRQALRDPDPSVRMMTLQSIGQTELSPQLLLLLQQATLDRDETVRSLASSLIEEAYQKGSK